MWEHYSWKAQWQGFTKNDVKDAAIHELLSNQLQREGNAHNAGYYTEADGRSGLNSYFGAALSKVGTVIEYNTTWTASIYALIHMLPVLQAMFLLALFAFMPFIIVLACFSWRCVITALLMTFALIMMTWLWHLVSYFDNLLITSLYTSTKTGYENIGETIVQYLSPVLNPATQIIDMAMCLGYVALPMFILGMIGWTGFNPGSAGVKDGLSGADNRSQSIGKTGFSAWFIFDYSTHFAPAITPATVGMY